MQEKTTFLLILFAVYTLFQNINLDFKPFYGLLFQQKLNNIKEWGDSKMATSKIKKMAALDLKWEELKVKMVDIEWGYNLDYINYKMKLRDVFGRQP